MTDQTPMTTTLCDDCPPVGYPTDKTRCAECPRRTEGVPMTTLPADESVELVRKMRLAAYEADLTGHPIDAFNTRGAADAIEAQAKRIKYLEAIEQNSQWQMDELSKLALPPEGGSYRAKLEAAESRIDALTAEGTTVLTRLHEVMVDKFRAERERDEARAQVTDLTDAIQTLLGHRRLVTGQSILTYLPDTDAVRLATSQLAALTKTSNDGERG